MTGRAPRAATLDASVRAFCTVLRDRHGFPLGPGDTLLALQAVDAVGLARPGPVRAALRAVCCARAEHLPIFDEAFDRHFLGGRGAAPTRQDDLPETNFGFPSPPDPDVARDAPDGRSGEQRTLTPGTRPGEESGETGSGPARHAPAGDEADTDGGEAARAQASAETGDGHAPDAARTLDRAYDAAAREFLHHLRLRPQRRLTHAARGTRLDPRRTLRAALATEGEAFRLYWRARAPRRAKVVLLIDASRSMDAHAQDALRFAAALSRRTHAAHTFSFSTGLHDLTPDLQAGRDLPPLRAAWGGGTRIGPNLQAFLQAHGDRLLGPGTIVVIVSDALDVGDTAPLAHAMSELARRSAGVLWLNPLAAHPGFQPTARGMVAALPHLTLLAHADTHAEYAALRLPGR
ncbi:vWA domain-containing protein [Deinococcus aquiradiocola]|uniref:VWA domain-containing protein n=1 Tax=Deinococcus aquiradiocola TaxID=393059 RepID=A0A917PBL4_9DEIO|nr:VWA domain-containing protein [Deinococcus aquiradiocola]GGJ69728.1 VWA domain-containing protein [Deinococcus aquiradiocola]